MSTASHAVLTMATIAEGLAQNCRDSSENGSACQQRATGSASSSSRAGAGTTPRLRETAIARMPARRSRRTSAVSARFSSTVAGYSSGEGDQHDAPLDQADAADADVVSCADGRRTGAARE